MLTQVATPFDFLAEDPVERKVLQLKADYLILLTMDYDGGANGLSRFARELEITEDQARAMLTGDLGAINMDLLLSCLFRKGYSMTRQLVHSDMMNMQLSR
ncbi:hypothetical protein [Pantoea eucrina]|uniref:hypothetical protein n=1 Tax=Pantoea eucrina TaxID=472693 RepID=UPI00080F37F1|nr:hypothetical protein [Pantoea eucrina]